MSKEDVIMPWLMRAVVWTAIGIMVWGFAYSIYDGEIILALIFPVFIAMCLYVVLLFEYEEADERRDRKRMRDKQ